MTTVTKRLLSFLAAGILALGLAACGTGGVPGTGTAPTADEGISRGSTMFSEGFESSSRLMTDEDYLASEAVIGALGRGGIFGLANAGSLSSQALSTLGLAPASGDPGPSGHFVWNESTGEWDKVSDTAIDATYDATFLYENVLGDGRDAVFFLSYEESSFDVGTTTHTFMTMVDAKLEFGGVEVATFDLDASYDVVTSRCDASEEALQVTSFDLQATAAGATMTMAMSTAASSTTGSMGFAYDGDSLDMSFSVDTRFQFAHETPCADGDFGEPTTMSFSVDASTATESASFSVDLTGISWATDTSGLRYIQSFDLDMSVTFDGTAAITAVGSVTLDATGDMIDNDVIVNFGDGPMPLDDVLADMEPDDSF